MIKEIKAISQVEAEGIDPLEFNDSVALISIRDDVHFPIRLSLHWKHIISLFFSDIDPMNPRFDGMKLDETKLFNDKMALQILDFVDSLPPDVEKIIIHCYAGISRSQGVAKFLCEFFNLEFDKEYEDVYNPHVYKKLERQRRERAFKNGRKI
jgi:predicted protein tyrosine phosphatase